MRRLSLSRHSRPPRGARGEPKPARRRGRLRQRRARAAAAIAARGRRQDRRAARSPLAFGLHCLLRGARYRGHRRALPLPHQRRAAVTSHRLAAQLHGSHTSTHIAGAAEGTPETNVIAGSTRLNVHPPIDATRDWALVRLARPRVQGRLVQAEPQAGRGGDAPSGSWPRLQRRLPPRPAEVAADVRIGPAPSNATSRTRSGARSAAISPTPRSSCCTPAIRAAPRRARRCSWTGRRARRSSASTSAPTCNRR